MIFNIYKPIGQTPLEAIRALKAAYPQHKKASITYAGRLDPMAEGVLLALSGEDINQKEHYLSLDKKYTADILLGINTDSYDILGMPKAGESTLVAQQDAMDELKKFTGDTALPFPPYSAYKIKGKPLHWWARQDRLDEIEIPIQHSTVKSAELTGQYTLNGAELLQKVEGRISLVRGDFRQGEIMEAWKRTAQPNRQYQVCSAHFYVSSGTYIRSITQALGEKLGTGATLLSLVRTRVGDFTLKESRRL